MNVVSRVEKLLALANGGSTEEEARTATREAARLISLHGLKVVEALAAMQAGHGTFCRCPSCISSIRQQAADTLRRQAQERAEQAEREQRRKEAHEKATREAGARSGNARHHDGPADLKFARVRSTRLLACARCRGQIRVGETIAWPGGYYSEHAMHERCYRGAYEEQP